METYSSYGSAGRNVNPVVKIKVIGVGGGTEIGRAHV